MKKHPELQFEEHMQFQKIEWIAQRVGWLLWLLILGAAMAGLLGTGPLSNAESTTPDGALAVAYERFLRFHHPTSIELAFDRSTSATSTSEIKISQSLLDRIQLLRIEPEPADHRIEPDGVVYAFEHAAGSGSGKVTFHAEYEKAGRTSGTVTLVGHEPVAITQFVYP